MRTLSAPFETARRALHSAKGWILLARCPLASGGEIRVTSNVRHVTCGGLKYQACSMKIDAPAEELQGSLGRMDFSLPNVSRIPITLVENDELLGQVMTWAIMHEDVLAAGMLPGLTWRHRVLAASIDEGVAKIECGHPASLISVPGQVYDARTYPSLVAGAVG